MSSLDDRIAEALAQEKRAPGEGLRDAVAAATSDQRDPQRAAPGTYALTFTERPWSLNDERNHHWSERAERVGRWRGAFAVLALEQDLGHADAIAVTAEPHGIRQDIGNCYPAVKAAIDGLIDARVIEDDDPTHLHALTFLPARAAPAPALTLHVTVLA